LEDGDILHESIERFAEEQGIMAAALILVGAADENSKLVVGPREGRSQPIDPMELVLEEAHEIAGTGTIFPDEKGKPTLHMHIAAGREGSAKAGCVRRGVKIWHIAEIVLFELTDTRTKRRFDSKTGFELLSPEQ